MTGDESLRALQIIVKTVPGFTGKTYLGVAGMNKNSPEKAGVLRVLAEPSAFGPQDGEAIPPSPGAYGNTVAVADFWIDADVANEGVIVSYVQG